jgi:Putative metallopeptidase
VTVGRHLSRHRHGRTPARANNLEINPNHKVCSMKRIVIAAAATLLMTSPALHPTTAAAQAPLPLNDKIKLEYAPTTKFAALSQRLKTRGILEQYSQFLSPLRLKHDYTVTTIECGKVNADYSNDGKGNRRIRLCYEFIAMVEDEAAMPHDKLPPKLKNIPNVGLMPGFTRAEVIIGGIIQVLLHETGHAVFNIQDIPRLGREEDAADGISGLMMLQFGKSVAITTIKGAVNVFNHMDNKFKFDPADMADVHSLDIQRLYNYLCLAYGSEHKEQFQALADKYLPAVRKANCPIEYKQALRAFEKTVLPDVDRPLMMRVREMQILRPEDSKL